MSWNVSKLCHRSSALIVALCRLGVHKHKVGIARLFQNSLFLRKLFPEIC